MKQEKHISTPPMHHWGDVLFPRREKIYVAWKEKGGTVQVEMKQEKEIHSNIIYNFFSMKWKNKQYLHTNKHVFLQETANPSGIDIYTTFFS